MALCMLIYIGLYQKRPVKNANDFYSKRFNDIKLHVILSLSCSHLELHVQPSQMKTLL